jgi:hypothetical protein
MADGIIRGAVAKTNIDINAEPTVIFRIELLLRPI